MKIAVVHDYFNQSGGAEKVAEELYAMIPGAQLVTTVAFPEKMPPRLKDVPVQTSWIQRMPRIRDLYRIYFPLYPFAVDSLDLSAYDLVVSSSSGYAKGVKTRPGAVHVCYCHTPMRWVWDYNRYSARETFSFVQKLALPLFINRLRKWDIAASKRPTHYVANSHVVADRILAAYGRTSEVIYPPIDVDRFSISDVVEDYYLVLARLVSYKRIDIAVRACTKLNRRLCIIGSGPDTESLKAIAGPTVEFLGRLSDTEVNRYISRCRALLFPGEEDFGMVPLETAAAGRPTIAYRAGGATETIIDGTTGLFFDEQTPEAMIDAIERFEQATWNPKVLRKHAEKFSAEVFQERFLALLDRLGVAIPPGNAADTVREKLPRGAVTQTVSLQT
jgi:glycosyltransferase involved in cell wall biosynthesis